MIENEWGAGSASTGEVILAGLMDFAADWGWLVGVAAAAAVAWGVRSILNHLRNVLRNG